MFRKDVKGLSLHFLHVNVMIVYTYAREDVPSIDLDVGIISLAVS